MSPSSLAHRIAMPEPLRGRPVVRHERQRWSRIDRAEGELDIGYDAQDQPVRVEYHWIRYFSRANPELADVYTAELWVRQGDGDWLYLVRPSAESFTLVGHDQVRRTLASHLDLDVGA